MAEIKIQHHKKRAAWWPWVLLLLIPLLWLLLRGRGRDEVSGGEVRDTLATATSQPAMGTVTGAAGATMAGDDAVSQFTTFIATTDATRDETGQHAYTAEGLRRLAAAIDGSRLGAAAGARTSFIRAMGDSLQLTTPGNDRHSEMTRVAFDSAAAALSGMGAAGAALQGHARAVRPERHLQAQKAEIQRFFESARDALQSDRGAAAPR
jgi:hypothetical protein